MTAASCFDEKSATVFGGGLLSVMSTADWNDPIFSNAPRSRAKWLLGLVAVLGASAAAAFVSTRPQPIPAPAHVAPIQVKAALKPVELKPEPELLAPLPVVTPAKPKVITRRSVLEERL